MIKISRGIRYCFGYGIGIMLFVSGASAGPVRKPIREETVTTFGKVKHHVIARTASGYFHPPEAVETIQRGAYSEFVGFSVNNGFATWIAFDLIRREAIRVDHYSGDKIEFVPRKLPAYSTRKEMSISGRTLIEIVSRKPLDDECLSRLVGYANDLWASPPDFARPATDIHNAIVLLDGDTKKVIGGPGLLPSGSAEDIDKELRDVFRSDKGE